MIRTDEYIVMTLVTKDLCDAIIVHHSRQVILVPDNDDGEGQTGLD